MSNDYLQNPVLKQVFKTLGIPVPSPELLVRADKGTDYNELSSKVAAISSTSEQSEWFKLLQSVMGKRVQLEYYANEMDIMILDATAASAIDDIEKTYSFGNANIRKIRKNGKILVLASGASGMSSEGKVVSKSLDGFVKSLAKEMGGKGVTVNLLRLPELATLKNPESIWPLIHFFISSRSAFITGQVLDATAQPGQANFSDQLNLAGKWAVVTGAARGIGADTAKALAAEGAKVIVLDVAPAAESLQQVADEIGGVALPVDITSTEAEEAVRQVLKEHNASLDILVNNAGIIRDKTLAKMTPDQWRAVLNVNLKSVIRFTDALLADGLADNAAIIGLSSIAGIAGNMGQTNYAASKAGLIAYLREVTAANASRGITANAIAPGFIETPMTENLPFFVKEGGRRLSALKQGGLPTDIAQAVAFLSGPGGKYLSGQVLRVCGGSFLGA
jgi:3-oxoacyl-[acyl-carrier protein] reductase